MAEIKARDREIAAKNATIRREVFEKERAEVIYYRELHLNDIRYDKEHMKEYEEYGLLPLVFEDGKEIGNKVQLDIIKHSAYLSPEYKRKYMEGKITLYN